MKSKVALVNVLLLFATLIKESICSEVPVILWNIKGDSLLLKPVSAFGNDKKIFDESVKDILQKTSSGLLVFAVNALSMEDFSANEKTGSSNNTFQMLETFLDNHPHMLLPYVKDPLNRIHNSHCDVEEIIVDQNIDENVLQSVATAMDRSCAVILHVSDTSIMTKPSKFDLDHIKHVFLPSFANIKKNVVGMFSGMRSSWEIAASDHHSFRNLLQEQGQGQGQSQDESHLSNITCAIVYSENITYNNVQLEYPPSTQSSECPNSTVVLSMEFAGSGDVQSVTLRFTFIPKGNGWTTSDMGATIVGAQAPEGEIQLKGDKPEAPNGYSFSCGELILQPKNSTSAPFQIKITGFQVQPFQVSEKFSSSFDCTTYFTIPIWSGIFVGLIFVIIVNVGVYALFSVHTMDRFDDPKGKSITVAAATD